MTEITRELLEGLEEAARAATPSPWIADMSATNVTHINTEEGFCDPDHMATVEGKNHRADALFMARANPQMILALIEALRAERDWRLSLQAALEQSYKDGRAAFCLTLRSAEGLGPARFHLMAAGPRDIDRPLIAAACAALGSHFKAVGDMRDQSAIESLRPEGEPDEPAA